MTVGAAPPARIEARGWGLRHPGRRAWALRRLELTVEPGDRVLLLGASGVGKSTLLTAIAGLIDPAGGAETEGSLLVDGRDPRAARERSGLLFQDPESQIVMGRCGDDVAFGLENRCVPTEDIWPRVDAALADVAFPYGRDHPTHALSGGEQQRLALAGVLALRPGLLLLDEPTASLDADGAATLRSVLAGVLDATGATLLLVEHRVAEALPLIDRVVVLGAGGVVAAGTPDEVLTARGAELADAGVWVPGHEPPAPPRRSRPPAESLVVAGSVSFRYPGSDAAALAPVDVEVRSSEALAVVGRNGAGKSTLALMLAGLLAPTTGSVVAGSGLAPHAARREVAQWPAQRLVRNVGTVFQDPEHQFLASSVRDELLLGPRHAGLPPADAARRVDELLERLRLAHLSAANPYTLSGGEKRRLSVATALATAPRLLILDEPTFGQDRRTWGELVGILADLRDEGRGVCFVTHDRPLVDALADRTLSLPVAA